MIRFAFSTLKTDIKRYQAEVEAALRNYSTQIENDAKWYKEDICAQRKEEHLKAARESVKNAEAGIALASRVAANKMRDCLKSMTSKPINPDFLENMRIIREFGVKLDKTELQNWVSLAVGNLTALRILEEVAKASGFKLNYTNFDAFNADIERVERFGANCQNYAPEGMWNIAYEALPDVELRRDDGSVVHCSYGRPNATSLILGNAYVDSMLKDCDGDMLKRWTSSEVPGIGEIVKNMQEENNGEPADWHGDAAETEHETAVHNAEAAVSVEEYDSITARLIEEDKRSSEKSKRILQKYM